MTARAIARVDVGAIQANTARIAVEVGSDNGTVTSLSGRLLLTEEPPGEGSAATRPTWQVFGYDVARGAR